MKKIEAIVNPEKLNLVKNALKKIGVAGMTISEVRGFGNQGGHKEIFRGTEYRVDYIPKAKIEIVVEASMTDRVINSIIETAQGDEDKGGGKIFVYPLEQVIRIRTKEKGRKAI